MNKLKFKVDSGKCIRCGACIEDCVAKVFGWNNDLPAVIPEQEDFCIGCQHCLTVCPTGAVSIFGLNPENSMPVKTNDWPTAEQMTKLMRERRTIRKYRAESVDPDLIDNLLKTLNYSPTGRNERKLNFTVVENRESMKHLLDNIVKTIIEKGDDGSEVGSLIYRMSKEYAGNGEDILFRGAPNLLMAWNDPPAACDREDVIISLSYFELLAQCSGLGTTWCGYLKMVVDRFPELRPLLSLPRDAYFYTMLFGYPAVKYPRTVQRDTPERIKKLRY